jgi:hypothetical protein
MDNSTYHREFVTHVKTIETTVAPAQLGLLQLSLPRNSTTCTLLVYARIPTTLPLRNWRLHTRMFVMNSLLLLCSAALTVIDTGHSATNWPTSSVLGTTYTPRLQTTASQ